MKIWRVKRGKITENRRAKSRRTLLKQYTLLERADITDIYELRPRFR